MVSHFTPSSVHNGSSGANGNKWAGNSSSGECANCFCDSRTRTSGASRALYAPCRAPRPARSHIGEGSKHGPCHNPRGLSPDDVLSRSPRAAGRCLHKRVGLLRLHRQRQMRNLDGMSPGMHSIEDCSFQLPGFRQDNALEHAYTGTFTSCDRVALDKTTSFIGCRLVNTDLDDVKRGLVLLRER